MLGHTYLYNTNFIDDLYETYLADPDKVSEEWRDYFAHLQQNIHVPDTPHMPIQTRFAALAQLKSRTGNSHSISKDILAELVSKQIAVSQLIDAYRFRGHQQANLDPLRLQERPIIEDLKPSERGEYEITDVNNIFLKQGELTYDILEGDWIDAGTFSSLVRANQMLLEENEKY